MHCKRNGMLYCDLGIGTYLTMKRNSNYVICLISDHNLYFFDNQKEFDDVGYE